MYKQYFARIVLAVMIFSSNVAQSSVVVLGQGFSAINGFHIRVFDQSLGELTGVGLLYGASFGGFTSTDGAHTHDTSFNNTGTTSNTGLHSHTGSVVTPEIINGLNLGNFELKTTNSGWHQHEFDPLKKVTSIAGDHHHIFDSTSTPEKTLLFEDSFEPFLVASDYFIPFSATPFSLNGKHPHRGVLDDGIHSHTLEELHTTTLLFYEFTPIVVPIPPAITLMVSGILGLLGLSRWQN